MTGDAERAAAYRARGLWDDATVGWALPTAAQRWPGRVALVVGSERFTFAALASRTSAVVDQLRAAGVGRGDRVLAQLPNCAELVLLVLGAWHLGAVPVPVVPMYREQEMRHIVRLTRPAVVAARAELRGRAPAVELDAVLAELGHEPGLRVAVGGAAVGWSGMAAGAGDIGTPTPTAPDDPCLVLFTSGTTSAPKGVVHSSRALVAEARTYRDGAQLGAADAVLIPAPVAHVGALVAAALLPSVTGGRTVVLERWEAAAAARLGAAENVGLAVGAPVFLTELLDRYEADPALRRIPRFHTGAAPTGSSVIRRADAAGVTAWRAWGMTECPTVTYGGPDDPLELRESRDGRVEVGTEVRAVDASSAPLPPGEPGELQLRGPKLMLGYLGEDGVVQPATGPDGWFTTGDLGVVHTDGWVSIQGRTKDIINRGGEKFSAGEIEAAICSHPDIAAAAVLGVPDARLGEKVAAVVSVVAGRSWPGPDVLVAHLEDQRLARQKLPVEWRVVPELPRTATGKIRKAELLAGWTVTP